MRCVCFQIILLLSTVGLTPFFSPIVAIAQQELCRDVGEVPPASEIRTLALPQFGIDVDIPANYRAVARKDGAVQILDPGSYELMRCRARGGTAPFARGMSAMTIRLVQNPNQLGLLPFAQQQNGSIETSYRYNLSGTPVLITEGAGGYSVQAWFMPPKVKGVVLMEVTCDCELAKEDIVMELDRTRIR